MPARGPRYSEEEARRAVAQSRSYSEVLRRLGMRVAGHNHRTIRKYVDQVWQIPTDHFDSEAARKETRARRGTNQPRPLSELLVPDSKVNRGHLKARPLREGILQPVCELCGQGEIWQGHAMSLILDHVNGIGDDNRLDNLRIVCPNCAATLETHCGRLNRLERDPRECCHCGKPFRPQYHTQSYCSRYCGVRAKGDPGPRPHLRKVQRPPYAHLIREVKAMGYLATGRRYGVSDNAIRKWIRQYEKERDLRAGIGWALG